MFKKEDNPLFSKKEEKEDERQVWDRRADKVRRTKNYIDF